MNKELSWLASDLSALIVGMKNTGENERIAYLTKLEQAYFDPGYCSGRSSEEYGLQIGVYHMIIPFALIGGIGLLALPFDHLYRLMLKCVCMRSTTA